MTSLKVEHTLDNRYKNNEKFSKRTNEYFIPIRENYVKNLRFIYCAENYCLRRIPRLVTMVLEERLSGLLSDHVSILMDRLNRLDEIFKYHSFKPAGLNCSMFKSLINRLGSLVNVIHLNNRKENAELIDELIQISLYRNSVYLYLMDMACGNAYHEVINLLSRSLIEEDNFYKSLFILKSTIWEVKKPADNRLIY